MKKVYFLEIGTSIIAYHKDYNVIREYAQSVNAKGIKKIGRVSKKYISNKEEFEELYLIKYGDGYIPRKYLEVCELDKNEFISMFKDTKDSLITLIEMLNSKKDIKTISKAIDIIDRFEEDLENSVLSYDEMKYRYEEYNNFKYNIRKE